MLTIIQSEGDEKVPEVPTDEKQGILPKLIATLVSRRRQVKSLMKDKKASADELATWDIKQLALKLTANSMYGCLGYTQSRFYARPLAMLTTFKGREILRSTKDLAESTQLRVIYGDTDSVMINTNADSIEEALKVGNDFKRSVNERYKLLEIDIDNVFRRLLLHAKKKYAAINMLEVDGKYVDKLEVKGLDMKRREYCALSKEASSRLLNDILSGEDPEVVISKVHEYLRDLSSKMREEKIPKPKYIIYTVSPPLRHFPPFPFPEAGLNIWVAHIDPLTYPMLTKLAETGQESTRLPQSNIHALRHRRPPRPRCWQICPCQRRNFLHHDLPGLIIHLNFRTRRQTCLCSPGIMWSQQHPNARHRLVPLQANLPTH